VPVPAGSHLRDSRPAWAGVRPAWPYAGIVTGTHGTTPPGLDVTAPNVARMYDYCLGGKDNFEADLVAAERVQALVPGLRRAAVGNIQRGGVGRKPA
jgi:hypothetical protein